jgi:hypothetical protein
MMAFSTPKFKLEKIWIFFPNDQGVDTKIQMFINFFKNQSNHFFLVLNLENFVDIIMASFISKKKSKLFL